MKGFAGTTEFTISAAHPALAGHFPGAPVVPGVLLLAEALDQIEATSGVTLSYRRIVSAKFLRPVGPGETVTVQYQQPDDLTLTIHLCSAGDPVARVTLKRTSEPAAGTHV